MITIKQTAKEDIQNVKRLWADGEVMRFVGFPEGLRETDEAMREWLGRVAARRPATDHYSVYEDGVYCGETYYNIDAEHRTASLDIKLFAFARGRGIASKALSFAIGEAFKNGAETVWVDPDPRNVKAIALYERLGFIRKAMPEHLKELEEDPEENLYMEFGRDGAASPRQTGSERTVRDPGRTEP